MRTSDGYKTKQRAIIEDTLKKTEGKHITVDSMTALLAKRGQSVGRTTVYRWLEKLTEEGCVRKYNPVAGESACYQYVSNCEHCHEHFHLKCEKCGKLIHLECASTEMLCNHIQQEHGFKIDKFKTVLYGICEECAKK